MQLKQGKILISNPFLKDPNFLRAVILICEKDEGGSLGFILNKEFNQSLNELVELKTQRSFPVFYGGPVFTDNLYFLHNRPDLIDDGFLVSEGIYWGGNFEQVVANINAGNLANNDIKFYIGYSGWSEGQLEEEVDEGSWIIDVAKHDDVFNKKTETLWKDVLTNLGGEYKMMVNYPLDPSMN